MPEKVLYLTGEKNQYRTMTAANIIARKTHYYRDMTGGNGNKYLERVPYFDGLTAKMMDDDDYAVRYSPTLGRLPRRKSGPIIVSTNKTPEATPAPTTPPPPPPSEPPPPGTFDPATETDPIWIAPVPTLGVVSDDLGITVGWSGTSTPSPYGYNVYTRRSDQPSWMYQRRNGPPIMGTTYKDRSVWQGDTLWISVYAVNADGSDGALVLIQSVTQAPRAVIGPISKWSGNFFKPVWVRDAGVTLTYRETYTTVNLGARDKAIAQTANTYTLTNRGGYTLTARVRGQAGSKIQFHLHDRKSGSFQDFVHTFDGAWQTVSFTRNATSNGHSLELGFNSYGQATALGVDVEYLQLLPTPTTPYQKTKARVWEEPYFNNENIPTTILGRYVRSTDPGHAAVYSQTPALTTARNSFFFGYGQPGGGLNIINASWVGTRLHAHDNIFWSGNPKKAGCFPGRAVAMEQWKELRFTGNECYGTAGIACVKWVGSPTNASDTIQIERNLFWNLDGRYSDPTTSTGWSWSNNWNDAGTKGFVIANLIQLNTCVRMKGGRIGENYCVNFPNESRVEDIFSFYLASGQPDAWIVVENNIFRGAYVYDPWLRQDSKFFGNNMPDGTPYKIDVRGYGFSGGMGLTSDMFGAALGTPYTDDCAYVVARNNTVTDMSNYGLGASAGHTQALDDNDLFRSGRVHSMPQFGIAWRHVPVQFQDYATGGGQPMDDGTGTGQKRVRWYGHKCTNNRFGYGWYDPGNPGDTSQKYGNVLLKNSPVEVDTGNVAHTNVTPGFVNAKERAHRERWAAAGIVVGWG